MKRLLASTAIALMLGLAPALAETPAPANQAPKDPAMQDRLQPSEPAAEPSALPGQSSDAASPSGGVAAHILARQEPGEWLATELIGRSVVNTADETIGDVNDLITDAGGKTIAAVIGVGGFLGIGEKDVAVSFAAIEPRTDEDGDVTLYVNATQEQLEAAPEFKTLADLDSERMANQPAVVDPAAPAPVQ